MSSTPGLPPLRLVDHDTAPLPVPAVHRAPRAPVGRRRLALLTGALLLLVVAIAVAVAPVVRTSGGDGVGTIPTAFPPEPSRPASRPPVTAPPSAVATPGPVEPSTPATTATQPPASEPPAPAATPPPATPPPATPPPATPPPAVEPTPCDAPGNSERANGNGRPRCP